LAFNLKSITNRQIANVTSMKVQWRLPSYKILSRREFEKENEKQTPSEKELVIQIKMFWSLLIQKLFTLAKCYHYHSLLLGAAVAKRILNVYRRSRKS